jgi:hypothetical protein
MEKETEQGEQFWRGEDNKNKSKEKKDKKKLIKKEKRKKVNLEGEKIKNGLGQLVLTVIELLRELMEKQALRRIEKGKLSEEQIEKLGNNFKRLKDEVENLKKYFELEDEDLNLELGPVTLVEDESGKASVVEILDRLLGKGIIVKGDIIISVAEVDLLSLNLGLLLASIDKAQELYDVSSSKKLQEEVRKLKEENERLRKKNKG